MTIKIVLTGGPGSGKTKTIEFLKKRFYFETSVFVFRSFRCLFIPETASELILGGVAPFTCRNVKAFQSILFDLQLEKERAFDEAVRETEGEDFIIFYDRGLIDGGAYLSDEEFDELLREKGTDFEEIFSRYDSVIALEGHESFYSTEGNKARTENASDAESVNERTKMLWSGHRDFRIVPPRDCFALKAEEVLKAVEEIVEKKSFN